MSEEYSWYDKLVEEDVRWGGVDAPRWTGLNRRHMTLAQLEEILKSVEAEGIAYRKRRDENEQV